MLLLSESERGRFFTSSQIISSNSYILLLLDIIFIFMCEYEFHDFFFTDKKDIFYNFLLLNLISIFEYLILWKMTSNLKLITQ